MKTNLMKTYPHDYSLFDAFDDFFRPMFADEHNELKTDIKESDEGYDLEIAVPGYQKDQIKISLEDGYLTVSCAKTTKEEEGKKHYLRKEISESCQRSYYVGTDLSQEDIKAKYENGMLILFVPKTTKKAVQSNLIAIE